MAHCLRALTALRAWIRFPWWLQTICNSSSMGIQHLSSVGTRHAYGKHIPGHIYKKSFLKTKSLAGYG